MNGTESVCCYFLPQILLQIKATLLQTLLFLCLTQVFTSKPFVGKFLQTGVQNSVAFRVNAVLFRSWNHQPGWEFRLLGRTSAFLEAELGDESDHGTSEFQFLPAGERCLPPSPGADGEQLTPVPTAPELPLAAFPGIFSFSATFLRGSAWLR